MLFELHGRGTHPRVITRHSEQERQAQAGQMNVGVEEVCHTISATKDRGCNAKHSFAEGSVNLLGAYDDDCEDEVQGPPGLDGRHIS